MKLKVVREAGEILEIDLQGRLSVVEGKVLNYIRSEEGTEYYFTKDGYYDGYGALDVGVIYCQAKPEVKGGN